MAFSARQLVFETFILKPFLPDYESPHPQYDFLFNSYYQQVGERHCRPKRGLISRPTVEETYRYRAHVDLSMLELLESEHEDQAQIEELLTIGLHHEQQHQELMLTDIKYNFSQNPLRRLFEKGVLLRGAVLPLWNG